MEQPLEVEQQLLKALRTRPVAPAPPPRSVDELFLLSLVSSMQRLPPQTKECVKFQILKLIYEAAQFCLIWKKWSLKSSFNKEAAISAGNEPDFLSFTLTLTLPSSKQDPFYSCM